MDNNPVLDLININQKIYQNSDESNGLKLLNNRFSGRFEIQKNPPDLRGLILKSLIYANYKSLEQFAKKISRTKVWVWMLIYTPEKVKIKSRTEQIISEALGIKIALTNKSKGVEKRE